MSNLAQNLQESVTNTELSNKIDNIKAAIEKTHSAELIITLCGFMGTNIKSVAETLKSILENTFSYKVEIIKLSAFIRQHSQDKSINKEDTAPADYINGLIDAGNKLREKYSNDILAQLAIQKINYERIEEKNASGEQAFRSRRVCYIIDSIKHKEELELFKSVYREIHYSIGIFSPEEMREDELKKEGLSKKEIINIIDRDSDEQIKNGQQVRDTFTMADYFLRLDTQEISEIDNKLDRLLNLIFASKIITPTIDETAMFHAASAASKSACLSRQVGAALTDSLGEILSLGWNDVPKYGGGLYDSCNNTNEKHDARCYNWSGGACRNDFEKNEIAKGLVNELIDAKIVAAEMRDKLLEKVKASKIKSLIEFSRAIHAEMHAIIQGSQLAGKKVQGGSLYITTYPCHNCARHIIVAGIKKVYYIEPYKKSLTTKLHSDAITEREGEKNKVTILMYEGVAPSRYIDLFKMLPNSRKNNKGRVSEIAYKEVKPKSALSLEAFPALESKVAIEVTKKGIGIIN